MTTTCQKCIHYEICKTRIDFNEYALEMQKFKCPNFKNNSDVVKVVRCKECKHFITDTFKRTMCNRTFTMFEMNENDFCSFGVRKEGAEK